MHTTHQKTKNDLFVGTITTDTSRQRLVGFTKRTAWLQDRRTRRARTRAAKNTAALRD